ncbi:MAG: hypothetical protein AAFQ95_04045 [Cyanobacteria bacterium J06621_3]
MKDSSSTKRIKIVSTGAVLAAVVLQALSVFIAMPGSLQPVLDVTKVLLIIHGIEGAIASILILRYKLRPQQQLASSAESTLIEHLPESTALSVIKAGLYVFFVGTVGLTEIVRAVKSAATKSLYSD